MSRPKGGRHRNAADSRRRMFLAIILAFALSGAAISLWALDSPLDDTAAPAGDHPTSRLGDSAAGDDARTDVRIDDASIRPQEAEEAPTTAAPREEEPTADPEPDPEPEPDQNGGGEPEPDRTREDAIVQLVNDERAEAGCGELRTDGRLDDAARLHAEDMAANDYFAHESRDGRGPTDRAAEQGYEGGVGENIAMGYPDPASVMDAWMNSEGHRANILNCGYSVIGVGIAERGGTIYWVQNFG
ncbi:hypothetical protein GCM10027447_09050 [Glycomyces halotolerans]